LLLFFWMYQAVHPDLSGRTHLGRTKV
jgi:hypothetical protein